jgi:hypothetical protein
MGKKKPAAAGLRCYHITRLEGFAYAGVSKSWRAKQFPGAKPF